LATNHLHFIVGRTILGGPFRRSLVDEKENACTCCPQHSF
jgi:hypothetical protein